MSPIGRVFIVLNLVLAGGFVAFAGTHLQKQHNYKSRLEAAEKAHAAKVGDLESAITKLEGERNNLENAKTTSETLLGEARTHNQRIVDENKQLSQQLAQFEGDMKQLVAANQAAATEIKSAFAQAKAAFDMAQADQKTKDESVRAKDDAVAQNRNLTTEVTSLKETIAARDAAIAGLTSEKSSLQLLVKVAEANGFTRSMAAPNLAGLVTNANGALCTIQITDNPGNINIKEAIELGKWGFAIYDASGYKGEAIAERYEESANAVLCKVMPVNNREIKEGDKAATKTP